MKFTTFKYSAITIALTALLSACGGGGGGDNNTTAPFPSKSISGKAVDFYLADATVQFDDCNDSTGNPVFVKTNANGQFQFNTTENCQNTAITVTGGTDIATGLPFTGTLKLKKTNLQAINNNSAVISPLTTLQSYLSTSNNAKIKNILENLGMSAETIDTLEGQNFDLSRFDPATEASAHDMAVIFAVQQLANQIEDSIVGKGSIQQDQATEIAFGAIIKALETAPLFTPDNVTIDAPALNNILIQAITVDAGLPNSNAIINQINTNITSVTDALETIVSSGTPIQDLQNAIKNDTIIVESLKTPVYSDFSLANYSLVQLKNSSSTSPLNIDLGALNTTLSVDFKLNNTQVELSDTIKLAFKLTGQSGAQTETLNVTVNNIALDFNTDGSIKKATLPVGTKVNIVTSLSGVTNTSFTLTSPVDITSANGQVSLQNLIDSNTTLKGYYNQYSGKLKVNDTVQVSSFVLPMAYVIDANLGLTTGAVNFGGDNYLASTLTAYFKLN